MLVPQVMAEGVSWPVRVLLGGLQQTVLQLGCLVLPFCLIGLLLHVLERTVQVRLARRFGWRSVLWTGWLGTPVHELSHAAMCLVFAHRIEEIALFKPDVQAGRLGYVRHSYNRRNLYQVAGNLFIGLAPLLGGALVLYGLLWVFFPSVAREAFSGDGLRQAIAGGQIGQAASSFVFLARDAFFSVVTLEHVFTWQFWVFLYLSLCVGSHLAPSMSDYRGAASGGLLVLGLLLTFNLLHLTVGADPGWLLRAAAPVCGPALALFALCVALCGIATLAVFLLSGLLDYLFGSGAQKG